MLPAAHVVGPVYPIPPHCPYFATDPVLLPVLPLALVVVDPPLPTVVVLALLVELEAAAALVYVATTAGPVGDSLMASFARTQPDFAVSAAGHSTC